MDADVPMDQDDEPRPEGSKPSRPTGEGLAQYNLDEYDNEDAMPGAYLLHRIYPSSIYSAAGLALRELALKSLYRNGTVQQYQGPHLLPQ